MPTERFTSAEIIAQRQKLLQGVKQTHCVKGVFCPKYRYRILKGELGADVYQKIY